MGIWAEMVARRVGHDDLELELVVRHCVEGKGLWLEQLSEMLEPGDTLRLVLRTAQGEAQSEPLVIAGRRAA